MKEALFHPAAIATVRSFPEKFPANSLGMPTSRPMPSVGRGVHELRLRDRGGIYRAFYFAQHARGILVLHAFAKKTQTTSSHDLELGRKRLREMLDEKL